MASNSGLNSRAATVAARPWSGRAHVRNGAFSTAERTWLPVPAEHLTHAVDTQHGIEGSVLEFYRALLVFRKAHPALAKGKITLLDSTGDILAFTREDGAERLLCVFNMGDKSRRICYSSGPRSPSRRMPRRHCRTH
jgi:alpha-glucosidase